MAAGIWVMLTSRMIKAVPTYNTAIKGTILSVTLAMDLMPPMITSPTRIARMSPNNQPVSTNSPNVLENI